MSEIFIAFVISWSVIDGDTIKVEASVWPGIVVVERVRLNGIDAPEMRAPKQCEREVAVKAKVYLSGRLSEAKRITLFVSGRDSFGRVLASIDIDGADLGALMLTAKLARPYGKKSEWC